MICRPHNQPDGRPGHRRHGLLDERAARAAARAPSTRIKHTTRSARALVKDLQYRLDVNTLHRDDDGRRRWRSTRSAGCSLRTTQPLFFDEYRRNRDTGSFILIDEARTTPSAAGMILGPTQ